MLEFFLWILWFFLLFRIIGDIFRNHDASGWTKALWMVFVIILPFLGVLIYVIVNGSGMGKRDIAQAQQRDEEVKAYPRQTAGITGGGSHADDLAELADLKDKGSITDAEFQQAKAKILA